jgi:uncharacterized protein YeaO (DUF488 family)
MIQLKRVYSERSTKDGVRILVDRVWPRGVTKARARIDDWKKELAPSTALRKWFGHDPAKWRGFRARYRRELTESGALKALQNLVERSGREPITLVYSAADEQHNQAVALKEILRKTGLSGFCQ